MLGASDIADGDRTAMHLLDPMALDPFALDELKRRGPKYGVFLPQTDAEIILCRLSEHLEIYKVSSLGYNNRLYFVTTKSGREFVIKICGRYWNRVKTETEVVGLFLAGKLSSVPAPKILSWDARGEEFGVEYTVMRRLGGVQLKDHWGSLPFEKKRNVIGQLAELVVSYKSGTEERLSAVLPKGKIGNFVIRDGDLTKSGELEAVQFDIGATLEGLGPWSSYKAYLRTQIEVKMENVRKEQGMESMRLVLPRVERLLAAFDTDETIADSHRFVFTHGDLNLQNLLITYVDDLPTITAVLDWEWSGMFPAEEEYFCSFDFILNETGDDGGGSDSNRQLMAYFFSILEDGGVDTPRTIAYYQQRKDLYDLRENLFPWYITDCDDVAEAAGRAVQEVHRLLEKLNF